jgi:hypothetical protein
MDSFLDDLPERVRVIGFTGGEPFLHPGRLCWLLERVSATGRVSTVITNALWSRDWPRARDVLNAAFRLGLRGLFVSLDDYHRPAVPVSVVARLLEHARALGIFVGVQGVGRAASRKIARIKKRGISFARAGSEGLANLERVGEAQALSRADVPVKDKNCCLNAMDPLVTHDGKLYACCSPRVLEIHNPVLFRGVLRQKSIGSMLDLARRDYLLAAVIVLGPAGLATMLGNRPSSGRNVTRCEECLRILEDPKAVATLRHCVADDRELRKEIAGRHLLLEKCYLADMYAQLTGS